MKTDALITASPLMRMVLDQARHIAPSKIAVTIEGESGTGKELLARLIHQSGTRASAPYVCVNCAALSESLIESELFGHEKGAFTGAAELRRGRFELAHGGTILLDEITEMPLTLQAKLLRVLEEEEFERVGGTSTLAADVRVIATTNRNLESEVVRDRFRRDLYYRLNGVTLFVPPLRQRREDIPVLIQHFFTSYSSEAALALQGVSKRALQMMTDYSWPGNVRELRNAMRRACLMARGPEIQPEDLPQLDASTSPDANDKQTLAAVEQQMILGMLRKVGGNKTAAAAALGITARTLHNKLNRYRQSDAA
jgi:DNA-binding NtrC family response regulator